MKRNRYFFSALFWNYPLGAADRIRIGYRSIGGAARRRPENYWQLRQKDDLSPLRAA